MQPIMIEYCRTNAPHKPFFGILYVEGEQDIGDIMEWFKTNSDRYFLDHVHDVFPPHEDVLQTVFASIIRGRNDKDKP